MQRTCQNDFKNRQRNPSNDVYYDLEYDKTLIEQSIAKQYHILPSEQENLHYRDWEKLVAGLMDDTPLGRIVQIRGEKNKDIIKKYTSYEKNIRCEWGRFRTGQLDNNVEDKDKIKGLQNMIAGLFGGGKNV